MNHSHVLYDSDPHFKIDPISRKITNESSTKTTIIQHDHNSERFTFECPRYVEGHDLSKCNVVEVHYMNIEANTKIVRAGVYSVDDLRIKDDDDDTVVCSWLVANNATQLVGQLQFLVRFSCTLETTGKVEYVWNTGIYSAINVLSGIYNNSSPSDNIVPPFNFVTTINGYTLKFFVGTKAEYDTLTFEEKQGLYAIITDDTTREDIDKAIEELILKIDDLRSDLSSGELVVSKANHANTAENIKSETLMFGRKLIKNFGNTQQLLPNERTAIINMSKVENKMLIVDIRSYGGKLLGEFRTTPFRIGWEAEPEERSDFITFNYNGDEFVFSCDRSQIYVTHKSTSNSYERRYCVSAIYEEICKVV